MPVATETWKNVPAALRSAIEPRLEPGESPCTWFETDLDRRLHYVRNFVVLTDRRVLGIAEHDAVVRRLAGAVGSGDFSILAIGVGGIAAGGGAGRAGDLGTGGASRAAWNAGIYGQLRGQPRGGWWSGFSELRRGAIDGGGRGRGGGYLPVVRRTHPAGQHRLPDLRGSRGAAVGAFAVPLVDVCAAAGGDDRVGGISWPWRPRPPGWCRPI